MDTTPTETDGPRLAVARPWWRDPMRWSLVGWTVLSVAIILLAVTGDGGLMTAPKAALIGAVEGFTEYLPVSSTGHLIVVQRLIGLGYGDARTAADTYAIAVQVGAILAVVLVYRHRISQLASGLVGRNDDGRRLLGRLVVAIAPAAVLGIAFGDTIKAHLFSPWPIVAAWVVGGIFLLWWKPPTGNTVITALTVRSALIIGIAQSLALWPGVSRSLVTLVAALAIGYQMAAAVEFSFLLGLATLTAATVLDLAKDGSTLLDDYGWQTPLLGVLVAFVTATIAARWMIAYLKTRPLSGFGWYRLSIAGVTVVLLLTGAI